MENRTPKYICIKNEIVKRIKMGKIEDKLPGERVLAKEFEVSYMTVRKAIKGLVEEGILYKDATKGTFVSNRKISPKITKNIGFLLDESIKDGISSPYYSLIFKALDKEVKDTGYNLTLFSDLDDLNPLNNQKKIDGAIICFFPRIEEKIEDIKELIPIVLLDNISSDIAIPSVTIDNFNSSRKSANYLCSLGHKRIGFISGLLNSAVCRDRLLGYTSVLDQHDLDKDKSLIYRGDYSYESGESGAEYLLSLSKPPTAIMCANDSMAIGAMKIVQANGLAVPNDISIIGFDDIEVASRVYPALTTVAAPIKMIAQKSVEMLVSIIKGNNLDYQHKILPAKLIIRDSCGKAPK
ncbi:MAG: GntR family transcriptional regulator [Candidatus Cloacimonetes bacterium]|nr:GntR family transcriptional regulator [Candidatus Cloacimonadota bacterium]MBS3767883.1 GntR family transcriptional regulator [Candidatus Cloacimonadota bacterium]